MRIVAGEFKGYKIRVPKDTSIRFTSEGIRETLFDIIGGEILGSLFLDLYAGCGSVGIEALSRGARRVVFVEKNPKLARIIGKNIESMGVELDVEVFCQEADKALRVLSRREEKFNFIFLDPPYKKEDLLIKTIEDITRLDILEKKVTIIGEHYRRVNLPRIVGDLRLLREVRQGDTVLSFYTTKE